MISSNNTAMITPADFEELLRDVHWSRTSTAEIEGFHGLDDRTAFGAGIVKSTLGDISITWFEGFELVPGEADSLVASTVGLDEYLVIEGVAVLDDEGETLSQSELHGLLPAEFRSVDYSAMEGL